MKRMKGVNDGYLNPRFADFIGANISPMRLTKKEMRRRAEVKAKMRALIVTRTSVIFQEAS